MCPNSRKSYAIFLNGEYLTREDDFYGNLIREVDCAIAVDGGQRIFERLGLTPDIIIADFDSSKRPETTSGSEVVELDSDKDKTDGELALELALDRGSNEIAICGYRGGPATDQILGNLLLLQKAASCGPSARVHCASEQERAWFIKDNTVELRGEVGEKLSVLALDSEIFLSAVGVRYPVQNLKVTRGETRGLSNSFTETSCQLTIKGSALIFQRKEASADH